MAKTPTCKHCNEEGHYKTWCPKLPRKPIKTTPKPRKTAKAVSKPKKKTPTQKSPYSHK